jgi:peptidoglycan/LPS O-acetylase OafA/YrhL
MRDMTRSLNLRNLQNEDKGSEDEVEKLAYIDGQAANSSTQWQSGLAFKMTSTICLFLSAAGCFWCFDHKGKHNEEIVSDKIKRGLEHANSDGMLDDCRGEEVEPEEQPLVYRPDIDGLRAIAVIGVIFYHFDVQYWKGAFVGVDVFYVISGFLITRIVFKEQSLQLPLWGFWVRRARRLFPALWFVLCGSVAAGWCLQSPERYQSLLEQVRYVLLWAANIRFYASLDYYYNPMEAPMLHMWSLAVEEQFYAIYPFLVWVLWRCKRKKTWIFLMCIITFTASLVLSIVYSDSKKRFSYYMTPPRAFELTMGCLLAFDTGSSPFENGKVAELCSWCGLAMIFTAYYTFEISMAYPSYTALLPCTGGALLIASNRVQQTYCARALSQWPIVLIGKVSYSWYLWHWPVRIFMGYYWTGQQTPSYITLDTYPKWLGIGLSFAAAVLSYYLVENPCRSKDKVPNSIFFAVSSVAWLALFGYTFHSFFMDVPEWSTARTRWW